MPRRARELSPTGFYHVMMRGNNRDPIFSRRDDKAFFLETLRRYCTEASIGIGAYCLMDNHVHLVLYDKGETLSKALSRINIKYAMHMNLRPDRSGHVFQDRFRSEVIADDAYLIAVIRYVHNNPVKANIVRSPADYLWSSYNEYLGECAVIDRAQRDFVLAACFGGHVAQYLAFHRQDDEREFLEVSADLKAQRLEQAQRVISSYCQSTGIQDARELYRDSDRLAELTLQLIEHSSLSHRQIAGLLGVSSSRVHKIAAQQ